MYFFCLWMEVKLKRVLGFLNLDLPVCLQESSVTKHDLRTRYKEVHQPLKA